MEETELLEYAQSPALERAVEAIVAGETAEARTRRIAAIRKRDLKCKSQIVQRIADSHLEHAKDKTTVYEVWKELSNVFERRGMASQLLLRKKLLSMKFKPSAELLSSHFLRFERIVRELKSTGATMEELDIVCHLLLTMPPEYDVVVTAIETLSTENLTLSFVKNRLLDEEIKRKGSNKSNRSETSLQTAFASSTSNNFKKGNNNQEKANKFIFRCHNCGLPGHRRAECKKTEIRE